ncbi:MAG TPA: NUDIX domain-containing protein [Chloroflexia bacterium]|nr:NUDIX domain-containing protein [Chloroflexia bacterium]
MRWTKVVAYIVREVEGKRQLLVLTHRDYPEAGLQVPAGTVDEGEGIEDALRREVTEETGLTNFKVVREIATYEWLHPITGNVHERHVFLLLAPQEAPDMWEWIETSGGAVPDHEGYVFCYYWADLDGEIELAGNFGDYLHAIR